MFFCCPLSVDCEAHTPYCCSCAAHRLAQVLQLNIFTSIGRGASVGLADAASGQVLAHSEVIQGGGVAFNVSWQAQSSVPEKVWTNVGCAYESPGGVKCNTGDSYQNCTTMHDCLTHDGRVWPSTGTCHGVHVSCIKGICQTGTPGGEACGHWSDVQKWKNIGVCQSRLCTTHRRRSCLFVLTSKSRSNRNNPRVLRV